jgi:hypothetical protein
MSDFRRKRRAALTPADVGLMDYGTRRVPGLRREEAAMLAGMSVTTTPGSNRASTSTPPTPLSTRSPGRWR